MKKITYFGADSSVGVTMLSQSVAFALAESKKRVLLILASSNPFLDYFNTKAHFFRSIDELRPAIRSNTLTREDVLNVCVKEKDVVILPPIKDLTLIRYYRETDLESITNVVSKDFDYIIIDGGCNIQYPLSISSLLCADQIFMVLSQQEKTLSRYRLLVETLIKPLNLDYEVILNKYDASTYTYNLEQIQSITKKEKILTIPYCDNGWEAEFQKETFLKVPKYKEGIRNTINEIVVDYTPVSKSSSRRFLEGWMSNEYGS